MECTDPIAGELLSRLLAGQAKTLGANLVGSYLFGSLATGDFDPEISDIDTVAVLRTDLSSTELAALKQLHTEVVKEMPWWDDRVEVVYLSSQALQRFRSGSFPAARISPGESFHPIRVDPRWLIDWYQLRAVGVTLVGPTVTSIVPVILDEEYVTAVRQHMLDWPDSAQGLTQGSQAYAILTMCRGLRTWRTGEHVSKPEAARWAGEMLPEHARLIHDALLWRQRSHEQPPIDGAVTRGDTERFVAEVKRLLG